MRCRPPVADPDRSEWLAGRLVAGVAALQAGRPHEAVPLLIEVCDDPELIAATDMRDIRSRALSLCSQALMQAGRAEDALRRVEAALVLARELGDTEGVHEVEGLRDQIRDLVAKRVPDDPHSRALASRTLAELEAEIRDPLRRAEILIRKANAEIEAGQTHDAVQSARAALAAAPRVPRIGVLARLTLVRADPMSAVAELEAAADVARDAGEFTLLGLVARAAELAGVQLKTENIADRSTR